MNRADLKSLVDILSNLDDKESNRLVKKIQKELKPITVASRKAKGRGLQQTVAKKVSEYTGIPWGYDNEAIQPRGMGQSGTDLVLIGEAQERFPFAVECKNVETFNMKQTIDQAKANSTDKMNWLIVHKRNGMEPIAMLDLDLFLKIFFEGLDNKS